MNENLADFPWSLVDELIPRTPGVKQSADLSLLPDAEFALIAVNDRGDRKRCLPCYDKTSAMASAGVLVAWSDRLPARLIKEAAARIRGVYGVSVPQLTGDETSETPTTWEFKRAFVPEKTSAPNCVRTPVATRISAFKADENPLKASEGEWVILRSVAECSDAAEKLSSLEGSRSSLTLFRAARAIVDGLREAGVKTSASRLAPAVLDYYAHSVSEDCGYALKLRLEDARDVVATAPAPLKKLSQSYLELIEQGLSEHESWRNDDAWRFAEKVSHMEEALSVDTLPIHRALFKTSAQDLENEENPIIYSAHNKQLRESELLALKFMDLGRIAPFFTELRLDALRTSPLETFSAMPESQKLFLLRFLSDVRTERGNRL